MTTLLTYEEKVTLLARNENTFSAWVSNTFALISFNMIFLFLFKQEKYHYYFLIIPFISIMLMVFSIYNYKKKQDSVINSKSGEELLLYYNIGLDYIYFTSLILFIVLVMLLLYFIKII
jgi:hypothetical protein